MQRSVEGGGDGRGGEGGRGGEERGLAGGGGGDGGLTCLRPRLVGWRGEPH